MRLLVPAAVAALIAATASSSAVFRGPPLPVVAVPIAALTARTPEAATAGPTADSWPPKARQAPVTVVPASGPAGRFWSPGFLGWPLLPRPVVHRRFEQPHDQWARGHRGVDLVAAVGQPVLSAGDGVVTFSGVIAGRGVMTVRHSGGLRTTYEPVDERLTSGTHVLRATRIGVVSPTLGHCLPLTCLHWGVLSGQVYKDPLSLLGFGRPILLPLG